MFKPIVLQSFVIFIIVFFAVSIQGQKRNSPDAVSYELCWQEQENVIGKIASDNDKLIYLPLQNGKIKSTDYKQNELWTLEIGGEIENLIFSNRILYVLSKTLKANLDDTPNVNNKFVISAVNGSTGIVVWKKEILSEHMPQIFIKENVLVASSKTRNDPKKTSIVVIEVTKGNILTEHSFPFDISLFYDDPNSEMLLGISDSSFYKFSVSTGAAQKFNVNVRNAQAVFVKDGEILVSDDRGALYSVNRSGAFERLKARFGGKITDISFYDERYLLSSLDNFLYLISKDGRNIVWKKRLSGRLTDKPLIFDHSILTFSQGDSSFYFINFDDGKITNRINMPDGEEIIGAYKFNERFFLISTTKGVSLYALSGC